MLDKIEKLAMIKADLKELKKEEKSLSDDFKTFLKGEGINSLTDESSGFKVSLSTSEKVDVNEELLLKELKKFIKENKDDEFIKEYRKCIKRVETVNEEQVESLIRSGMLPPEILEPAASIKVTERLVVNKAKKGAN